MKDNKFFSIDVDIDVNVEATNDELEGTLRQAELQTGVTARTILWLTLGLALFFFAALPCVAGMIAYYVVGNFLVACIVGLLVFIACFVGFGGISVERVK